MDFPGAVEDSSGEAAATGAGADVAAVTGGGKGFASAFNLLVAAAAAAVGEVTGPATGGVALPGEAAARALLLVGVGCFVGRVGSLGPTGIERLATGEALAVGWLQGRTQQHHVAHLVTYGADSAVTGKQRGL